MPRPPNPLGKVQQTTAVKLPPRLLEALEAEARKSGITRHAVIVQTLTRAMRRRGHLK